MTLPTSPPVRPKKGTYLATEEEKEAEALTFVQQQRRQQTLCMLGCKRLSFIISMINESLKKDDNRPLPGPHVLRTTSRCNQEPAAQPVVPLLLDLRRHRRHLLLGARQPGRAGGLLLVGEVCCKFRRLSFII